MSFVPDYELSLPSLLDYLPVWSAFWLFELLLALTQSLRQLLVNRALQLLIGSPSCGSALMSVPSPLRLTDQGKEFKNKVRTKLSVAVCEMLYM